ncbi:MAG: hypothetical protein V3576_06810 [Candidatus Cloacimonadota bacterium]
MNKYFIWFAAFILLLAGCHIEKPSLPSWEVELNVPLINEQYLLSDLVDSEFITIGENNVLYLENTGELSTPEFGELSFHLPLDTPLIPLVTGLPNSGTMPTQDPLTGFRISYARIAAGELQVRFTDVSDQVQSLRIVFDGIYAPDGTALAVNYVPGDQWQSESLIGAHFGVQNSGEFLDEISFSVEIQSNLPDGAVAGNLEMKIPGTLSLDHFQGHLENYVLDSEGAVESIDITYPHGVDEAIDLQTASLVINVTNHIGFPSEFAGEIYAVNNNTGQSRQIPIKDDDNNNFMIPAATGGVPATHEMVITTGIIELLEIMPHHIEIRNSSFRFGFTDPDAIGTVQSTSRIEAVYNVSAPFTFRLNDNEISLNEPLEIEISEDNIDRIRTNGISGGLRMQVLNKLPIGANASIFVATNDSIDTADPSTYSLRRDVTVASYQENSGFQVIDELLISPEELQIFTNPMIYVQMSFSFNTHGEFVTITASPADYIQVRGMLSAKLKVAVEED